MAVWHGTRRTGCWDGKNTAAPLLPLSSRARDWDWDSSVMHVPPCLQAPAFPRLDVVLSDGSPAIFPPAAAAAAAVSSSPSSSGGAAEALPAASLVCVAFRAGAQPMLEAWAGPFAQHFQGRSGSVALYELAIVEGVVSRRHLQAGGF